MNVRYSEKAKQSGEGYALLQQATNRLEEVLGPSADLVSAEWDRTQDQRGRTLYTLTVSDFTGEASASFTPEELQAPGRLRSRLLALWGDLLQARSDAQVKKLQELVKEGE
jgi:hypothetical protein